MRNLVAAGCTAAAVLPAGKTLGSAESVCVESDGGRVCVWVVEQGNLHRFNAGDTQVLDYSTFTSTRSTWCVL